MSLLNNRILAVVAGSALVVGLGATGAVAGNLIGSKDIRDGAVHGIDLADGVKTRINNKATDNQVTGLKGRVAELEGESGLTNVTTGAGYNNTWPGNSDALNTIVAKCDEGQVALSGGFSTWGGSDVNESGLAYDLGGDNEAINVTVSAPYTGEAYDENKYGGDIRPDRWVVKGYNHGATDQIVRAWVVCADADS
jgi:hypothetical protein